MTFDDMTECTFVLSVMCEKPVEVRRRRSAEVEAGPSSGEKRRARTVRVLRETEAEVETEAELATRSYGSVLRYQCGLARRFYDPELDSLYDERWMTCNWNQTWTLYDTIDSCVWTQCLNPPTPPPTTRLASTWSGDPVDFYGNVSFVCEEEELYFEWDREMEEFNITCQLGGTWDEPEEWPVCLPSK